MKSYGKVLLLIVSLIVVSVLSGCQTDLVGPSASMKIMYQGENNNQEHLSRSAGMTLGTGYGSGIMSWGLGYKEGN
jgi:hypothetical protein